MKKCFTLVEMLLVVIIIGILLLITLYMGWNYIKDMQFKNDKEEFVFRYNKLLSQSMGTNTYNNKKIDKFSLILSDQDNIILSKAITGSTIYDLEKKELGLAYFSGINGTGYIDFFTFELGCRYQDNDIVLTGGNKKIYIISDHNDRYTYCFDINLDSCKLKEARCLINKD